MWNPALNRSLCHDHKMNYYSHAELFFNMISFQVTDINNAIM